ncbi:hypothetical protein DP73_13690 [Desulfosporosinus sp. HMP52]|uniref:YjgB family protein n=1 Tax=Desulfosporosinus sp. HMP52 TaxID=1487923 RepID=UPI00051F8E54|nr:YjgB family protein [Desulfosporosinus sp. HMP52]KGK88145.1 hypothetical protein DP73_13690 [Desulfosporosinus sp. HMP52]
MINLAQKRLLKYVVVSLALALIVGCSPLNYPKDTPSKTTDSAPQTTHSSSAPQARDEAKELLLNIMGAAEQGKVINCNFPVKTTVIEDVTSQWGEPEKVDWVSAAKGNYATYSKQAMVFGFNKGSQIFEVRSFDPRLQQLSMAKTKELFGDPAYNAKTKVENGPFYNKKVNGEEIIGYTVGSEYKIEFVFPIPTATDSNPMMDHYLVLYPRGTVNNMADDPGRQW